MNNQLVSVCIPSYNASKHIRETIKSVLDSAYPNLEVIVNDDASTDNTQEIVEAFHDKRVLFFQNAQNLGPVKNWNCALKRASGEFVGLLNHDDLYDPFWITFAVHTLNKYPYIGWVASAFRTIDQAGQTCAIQSLFAETRAYNPTEVFPRIAMLYGLGPGYIARRQILEEIGYYDEDAGPGADNDLFLRLAARYPLYYSTRPHTAWRSHPDNLTHRWRVVQQAEEGFALLNKVFSDTTLPQDLRQYRERCYSDLYLRVLRGCDAALQTGRHDVAERLLDLLRANGYQD